MSFDPSHPLFAQALVAAERAAREGMPIQAETLNSQDPDLPIYVAVELLEDPRFGRALEELGVNWSPKQRVSSEQIAAARMYLAAGTRSHATRLRAAGVTSAKWAGWMRQPQFKAYIAQHSIDALDAALPGTHMALASEAMEGKPWAVQLLYQVTGFHDPNKVDDPRRYFERVFEVLSDEGVADEILRKVALAIRELDDPASAARGVGTTMIVPESPARLEAS